MCQARNETGTENYNTGYPEGEAGRTHHFVKPNPCNGKHHPHADWNNEIPFANTLDLRVAAFELDNTVVVYGKAHI